jgi:hypothetical protein
MKTPSRLSRVVASVLAFALIHASFGSQAWAQVVSVGAVSAPVGGSAAAAVNFSASANAFTPALSLSNAGLTGALSAPAVAPAPVLPAIAPAFSAAIPAAPSVEAGRPSTLVPAALVPAALTPAAAAVAAAKDEAPKTPVVSAAAPETSPVTLQAGPRTGRVASRAAAIISGVRAFFGGKSAESVPAAPDAAAALVTAPLSAPHVSDLTPAQDAAPEAAGAKSEPPAPPSAPNGGDEHKGWFGLGRSAVFFIGALVVAQIGVESLGAAMPALVQKTFGDFTVVAQLGIFASIASIVGRQLGPMAVTKWGLRKVYLAGTATRIVSISILCALLATAHMTLPLMMAFYCLNGLIGGVTQTAESSIPPALMGSDQAKIEKFWTWEQTLLEIIGVSGPIVTGAIVVSMGFLPALIAFPATFAIALAILFFTLRIPAKVEAMRLADLAKKQADPKAGGVKNAFGQFFHRIAEGAKLVWHNPLLRTSFVAFTVYMMLNPFLYSMIAPAFGIRLVGADHMAAVYGLLTGLYSLGGLLGGFLMIREQKKMTAAKTKGMTDAQESEALRQSMLKWMKWGVVGLLAILTLAFPIAPLGTFLALPGFLSWAGALTLPAVALIPFGIAQVIATVKLKSYFQSKVPEGRMPEAMGFFGSASLVVSTVGLLALKYLFKGVAGFTPFWIIAALMIPLGIYYLYLTRSLDKASAPPAAPTEK